FLDDVETFAVMPERLPSSYGRFIVDFMDSPCECVVERDDTEFDASFFRTLRLHPGIAVDLLRPPMLKIFQRDCRKVLKFVVIAIERSRIRQPLAESQYVRPGAAFLQAFDDRFRILQLVEPFIT